MKQYNPVVLLANHYQFSNSQRIFHPSVKSRMLLWCKSGKGVVDINHSRYEMMPGAVLFLPWNHSITYEAAERNPFLLGGLHLIPFHSIEHPVRFFIPHRENNALSAVSFRRDVEIDGIRGITSSIWNKTTPLFQLAEYAVRMFQERIPTESEARILAELFVGELTHFFKTKDIFKGRDDASGGALEGIFQFIDTHLHEPLDLRRLVRFSGKSPSTLCRLFNHYKETTPLNYILNRKIEAARRLLASETMTVAQVGQKVGIDDPYYFSKLFKKRTGRSPKEYRRSVAFL